MLNSIHMSTTIHYSKTLYSTTFNYQLAHQNNIHFFSFCHLFICEYQNTILTPLNSIKGLFELDTISGDSKLLLMTSKDISWLFLFYASDDCVFTRFVYWKLKKTFLIKRLVRDGCRSAPFRSFSSGMFQCDQYSHSFSKLSS